MLFEVAIIRKPTKKEIEEGTGQEQLILAPVTVLAADPQGAVISAVTRNGTIKDFDPHRCEVLVRPFAIPSTK